MHMCCAPPAISLDYSNPEVENAVQRVPKDMWREGAQKADNACKALIERLDASDPEQEAQFQLLIRATI